MPNTENHGFARPDEGTLENEWGQVINEELIDPLEERVPVLGEDPENITPHTDALLIEDDGTVHTGDGSAWSELGVIGGDYSDSDAVSAVEGSDLNVGGNWIFDSMTRFKYIHGQPIDTASNNEWFKIGQLNGSGANAKVIITETSRTGNTHETGIEVAAFKNGNAVGEHGGYWYQMQPPDGRVREGDFGYVETGDVVMDIYYRAGNFTKSSAILIEGDGVTYDWQPVGINEPEGIEYIDEVFPVSSPAEFGNDLNVGGALSEQNEPVATETWVDNNFGDSEFSGDYTDLTNRDHGNEDHSEDFAVDGETQPPENHANGAHSLAFISDGDGTDRQFWVSTDGSIPSGAANDDVVLTPSN